MFLPGALSHAAALGSKSDSNSFCHSRWEDIMAQFYRRSAIIVLTAAAFALTGASETVAQTKKPTYEQAWTLCKADVARSVPGDQAAQQHSRGASCMRKYGYRLKK
jgi:hypothetical protein